MTIYEDIIGYLPDYERQSRLITEILYATALKLEALKLQNEQNYNEIFIDTAVEALVIHAKDLGINLGHSLNIEQQRELITAHYRAAFEQTTEEMIKAVASSFSNGSVEVNKTDTPGIFEIKFVGSIGVPNNMDGLQSTINYMVPAHLLFIYAYIYNTHRNMSRLTHAQLAAFNHVTIREEAILNA